MIYCPLCHSTMVGKVGASQYYCRNCYYEFKTCAKGVKVFKVGEDGGLDEVSALSAQLQG